MDSILALTEGALKAAAEPTRREQIRVSSVILLRRERNKEGGTKKHVGWPGCAVMIVSVGYVATSIKEFSCTFLRRSDSTYFSFAISDACVRQHQQPHKKRWSTSWRCVFYSIDGVVGLDVL